MNRAFSGPVFLSHADRRPMKRTDIPSKAKTCTSPPNGSCEGREVGRKEGREEALLSQQICLDRQICCLISDNVLPRSHRAEQGHRWTAHCMQSMLRGRCMDCMDCSHATTSNSASALSLSLSLSLSVSQRERSIAGHAVIPTA